MLSTDAEIEAATSGLLDQTLPKTQWTHRAHFAAALWLLRHGGDFVAERDLRGVICAYNEATGVMNTDTSGYHETITQASLRAARMVLATHSDETPVAVVLDDLMGREFGRRDWMLTYWSREVLFSPAARLGWVEPDVQGLGF